MSRTHASPAGVRELARGVAGAAVIASVLLPWTSSGVGSAASAREVADLVLSGAVSTWAPRWAGLAVYAVPLLGCVALATAGRAGGRARALGDVAHAFALLTVVGILATVDALTPSRLAIGGVLAVVFPVASLAVAATATASSSWRFS